MTHLIDFFPPLFCLLKALLTYLGEVHRGVKGTVSDTFGNGIPAAFVRIKNRTFGSKTTVFGEYWRILRPGFYTIQVKI